jgi:hypothetical protein
MGLFDAFSADDATKRLNSGLQQNKNYTNTGINYGERYTGEGTSALRSGAAQGQDYLADANAMARGDITGGTNNALGYLDQGMDQAGGAIQQGIAPQQGLYDRGVAGIDLYSQLLNDPGSYSLTPGAQFQIDTGAEALNRTANSRGMLTSGNNTEDIMRLAQGIASQDYYKNLSARQPYFGLAQSGAQGVQSGYNQLAGLYDNLGANKARLAASGGTQLANLQSQYGQNASGVATGTGTSLAEMYQNQGLLGAKANMDLGRSAQDTQTNIAKAESDANAKMWEAILGGVSGVTGGITSYVGAGGRFA